MDYTGEKYLISELDIKYLSSLLLNVATISLSTTLAGSEFHALSTRLKKCCTSCDENLLLVILQPFPPVTLDWASVK